jgi:hypothetical protein
MPDALSPDSRNAARDTAPPRAFTGRVKSPGKWVARGGVEKSLDAARVGACATRALRAANIHESSAFDPALFAGFRKADTNAG